MKGVTLLLVFSMLLASSCMAIPEVKFQKDSYQPTETIMGTISNVSSNLTKNSLDIYEGRREVSFEKDLVKINNSYYFYIIPPKEGNFSLKIEDVLYDSNAGLASTTLQKDFNVSKKLNENNKTQILTIRPGFYVGDNPSISIINSGQENLNFSINEFFMSLSPGSFRTISGDLPSGFYFLKVISYEDFSVPIMNYGNKTNASSDNASINNNYNGCLSLEKNISIDYVVGNDNKHSIDVKNVCNFSLENINIASELDYIKLDLSSLNFAIDETKNISFNVDVSESGVFTSDVSFSSNNDTLSQIRISIFSFKNETGLVSFNQTRNNPAKLSCEDRNGTFCTQEQGCSSDAYDFYPENPTQTCCFSKCVNLGAPTNWNNVAIGLIGIVIIVGALYMLYRRSRKMKNANPEDKFKELDKRYQKGVIGKKK